MRVVLVSGGASSNARRPLPRLSFTSRGQNPIPRINFDASIRTHDSKLGQVLVPPDMGDDVFSAAEVESLLHMGVSETERLGTSQGKVIYVYVHVIRLRRVPDLCPGLNVVAFSGGVDSSLTTALALRCFGPSRVVACIGVSPSLSSAALDRARAVASALGADLWEASSNAGHAPTDNRCKCDATRCRYRPRRVRGRATWPMPAMPACTARQSSTRAFRR